MNEIVKYLTPDGMCGWDAHGQLWLWKVRDDGRPVGTIIGDPRGHKCRICQQGWILTVESLEDQERWREYEEWVHLSCSIRYNALRERDMWFDALVAAGIRFHGLEEIPNEYWARDPWWSKRPWYRVRLHDAPRALKLGRRKRVYHMEIEASGAAGLYSKDLADRLFKDEDVTKSVGAEGMMVHAWGPEKAKDYMKRFAQVLGLAQEADRAGARG